MTTPTYWPGQTVRVTARFRDEKTGELVSVTGIQVQIRKPDGNTIAVPVEAESTGVYTGLIVANLVGDYLMRATCTAPAASAEEGSFTVRPSLFS